VFLLLALAKKNMHIEGPSLYMISQTMGTMNKYQLFKLYRPFFLTYLSILSVIVNLDALHLHKLYKIKGHSIHFSKILI